MRRSSGSTCKPISIIETELPADHNNTERSTQGEFMQTLRTQKSQSLHRSDLPEGHFRMRLVEAMLVFALFGFLMFMLSP